MKFNQFIDRQDSLKRLRNALLRTTPQFLVIYGRRRIGKSTLIKEIMQDKDVYFLSDQTNEANQRALFAKAIAYSIPRFDKVVYPDWETLLLELNDRLSERITVCLDEFPYMVKSCASLPSVIQKLLNGKTLKYDLIIADHRNNSCKDMYWTKESLYTDWQMKLSNCLQFLCPTSAKL